MVVKRYTVKKFPNGGWGVWDKAKKQWATTKKYTMKKDAITAKDNLNK